MQTSFCAPMTYEIESERRRQYSAKDIFCELFDNSLDAGAQIILVTYAHDDLSITDDGKGSSNMQAFVQKGNHDVMQDDRARMGKYGVGLKHMSQHMYCRMTVHSICAGQHYIAIADWPHMVEVLKDWRFEHDCLGSPDAATIRDLGLLRADHGTKITFSKCDTSIKIGNFNAFISDMERIYYPAIKRGSKITIAYKDKHPKTLGVWNLPNLSEITVEKGQITRDKRFECRFGLITVGQSNRFPGFMLAYRHRILQDRVMQPCRGIAAGSFFAYVELDGDGWDVAVHKDGIVGRDRDALYDQLYEMCQGTLTRGAQQAVKIAIADTKIQLDQMMMESIQGLKKNKKQTIVDPDIPDEDGARGKRDEPGEEEEPPGQPTGTGGKHRRLNKTQRQGSKESEGVGSAGGKPRKTPETIIVDPANRGPDVPSIEAKIELTGDGKNRKIKATALVNLDDPFINSLWTMSPTNPDKKMWLYQRIIDAVGHEIASNQNYLDAAQGSFAFMRDGNGQSYYKWTDAMFTMQCVRRPELFDIAE